VGIIGVVMILGSLFFKLPAKDNTALIIENTPASLAQEVTQPKFPVRLKIPVIKVDALIESVGLTSDRAMDVPKNREDVGWFNLAPNPGDDGTAIIDGHYGQKNKKPSAFDNLHKLRKGDELFVEDNTGATIAFVVREILRYDPKADASVVFGVNTGPSHLNLITCEGLWDDISEGYPQRLVVFTDKK